MFDLTDNYYYPVFAFFSQYHFCFFWIFFYCSNYTKPRVFVSSSPRSNRISIFSKELKFILCDYFWWWDEIPTQNKIMKITDPILATIV